MGDFSGKASNRLQNNKATKYLRVRLGVFLSTVIYLMPMPRNDSNDCINTKDDYF